MMMVAVVVEVAAVISGLQLHWSACLPAVLMTGKHKPRRAYEVNGGHIKTRVKTVVSLLSHGKLNWPADEP